MRIVRAHRLTARGKRIGEKLRATRNQPRRRDTRADHIRRGRVDSSSAASVSMSGGGGGGLPSWRSRARAWGKPGPPAVMLQYGKEHAGRTERQSNSGWDIRGCGSHPHCACEFAYSHVRVTTERSSPLGLNLPAINAIEQCRLGRFGYRGCRDHEERDHHGRLDMRHPLASLHDQHWDEHEYGPDLEKAADDVDREIVVAPAATLAWKRVVLPDKREVPDVAEIERRPDCADADQQKGQPFRATPAYLKSRITKTMLPLHRMHPRRKRRVFVAHEDRKIRLHAGAIDVNAILQPTTRCPRAASIPAVVAPNAQYDITAQLAKPHSKLWHESG